MPTDLLSIKLTVDVQTFDDGSSCISDPKSSAAKLRFIVLNPESSCLKNYSHLQKARSWWFSTELVTLSDLLATEIALDPSPLARATSPGPFQRPLPANP